MISQPSNDYRPKYYPIAYGMLLRYRVGVVKQIHWMIQISSDHRLKQSGEFRRDYEDVLKVLQHIDDELEYLKTL